MAGGTPCRVMIRFAGRQGGRGFRIGGRGVGRVSEMANFIPRSCREAEISGVGVRAVSRIGFGFGGGVLQVSPFGFYSGQSVCPVNQGTLPIYSTKKDTGIRNGRCDFLSGSVAFARKIRYDVRAFGRFSVFVRGDRAGWVFRMVCGALFYALLAI